MDQRFESNQGTAASAPQRLRIGFLVTANWRPIIASEQFVKELFPPDAPQHKIKLAMKSSSILFVIGCVTVAAQSTDVAYPDSFRSWQHVKSVIATGKSEIFQFYANPKAVEGYRTGKFSNGSILVRDVLAAVPRDGDSKGTLLEGEHKSLDVMIKDDQLYKGTGGWGFETFDNKNDRATAAVRAQCYSCHSKQKEHDLVFSTLKITIGGVPYPDGYRHWNFLHSLMVPSTTDTFGNKPCEKPCTAGLWHFYANDKALEGLRTGSYPDGAVFAEEMLEFLGDEKGLAKEGQRRVVGVMVKDSQRYGTTGQWGYGTFDEGSKTDKLNAAARNACYQCHVARKDHGYVFAEYRER